MHEPIRTTCPYCGVGCGVLAIVTPDGSVEIKGDPEHPANYGRLCSKGTALGETLSLEGTAAAALDRRPPAAWSEALDLVASGSNPPSKSTARTSSPFTSRASC